MSGSSSSRGATAATTGWSVKPAGSRPLRQGQISECGYCPSSCPGCQSCGYCQRIWPQHKASYDTFQPDTWMLAKPSPATPEGQLQLQQLAQQVEQLLHDSLNISNSENSTEVKRSLCDCCSRRKEGASQRQRSSIRVGGSNTQLYNICTHGQPLKWTHRPAAVNRDKVQLDSTELVAVLGAYLRLMAVPYQGSSPAPDVWALLKAIEHRYPYTKSRVGLHLPSMISKDSLFGVLMYASILHKGGLAIPDIPDLSSLLDPLTTATVPLITQTGNLDAEALADIQRQAAEMEAKLSSVDTVTNLPAIRSQQPSAQSLQQQQQGPLQQPQQQQGNHGELREDLADGEGGHHDQEVLHADDEAAAAAAAPRLKRQRKLGGSSAAATNVDGAAGTSAEVTATATADPLIASPVGGEATADGQMLLATPLLLQQPGQQMQQAAHGSLQLQQVPQGLPAAGQLLVQQPQSGAALQDVAVPGTLAVPPGLQPASMQQSIESLQQQVMIQLDDLYQRQNAPWNCSSPSMQLRQLCEVLLQAEHMWRELRQALVVPVSPNPDPVPQNANSSAVGHCVLQLQSLLRMNISELFKLQLVGAQNGVQPMVRKHLTQLGQLLQSKVEQLTAALQQRTLQVMCCLDAYCPAWQGYRPWEWLEHHFIQARKDRSMFYALRYGKAYGSRETAQSSTVSGLLSGLHSSSLISDSCDMDSRMPPPHVLAVSAAAGIAGNSSMGDRVNRKLLDSAALLVLSHQLAERYCFGVAELLDEFAGHPSWNDTSQPPTYFGETLLQEHHSAGSFSVLGQQLVAPHQVPDNELDLYGGAQLRRLFNEVRMAFHSLKFPAVTEAEIMQLTHIRDLTDGQQRVVAACEVVVTHPKLQGMFSELVDILLKRLVHVLHSVPSIEAMLISKGREFLGPPNFMNELHCIYQAFISEHLEGLKLLVQQQIEQEVNAWLHELGYDGWRIIALRDREPIISHHRPYVPLGEDLFDDGKRPLVNWLTQGIEPGPSKAHRQCYNTFSDGMMAITAVDAARAALETLVQSSSLATMLYHSIGDPDSGSSSVADKLTHLLDLESAPSSGPSRRDTGMCIYHVLERNVQVARPAHLLGQVLRFVKSLVQHLLGKRQKADRLEQGVIGLDETFQQLLQQVFHGLKYRCVQSILQHVDYFLEYGLRGPGLWLRMQQVLSEDWMSGVIHNMFAVPAGSNESLSRKAWATYSKRMRTEQQHQEEKRYTLSHARIAPKDHSDFYRNIHGLLALPRSPWQVPAWASPIDLEDKGALVRLGFTGWKRRSGQYYWSVSFRDSNLGLNID